MSMVVLERQPAHAPRRHGEPALVTLDGHPLDAVDVALNDATINEPGTSQRVDAAPEAVDEMNVAEFEHAVAFVVWQYLARLAKCVVDLFPDVDRKALY